MNTIILDADNNFKDSVLKVARMLKSGSVVAFPTETVFGLGAAISNKKAIAKIFEVKGRPRSNPLSALIADISQAKMLSARLDDEFYLLAESFMPGPITIVVPKMKSIDNIVTAGLSTIGIRMPDHKFTIELIKALGEPLATTSANISGEEELTELWKVREIFGGKIDAIINYNSSSSGKPSTVVSLAEAKPVVLREGEIRRSEIEKILNQKY